MILFCFWLQILTLYDSINVIDINKVVEYVQSLQKEDGSFAGDIWGNVSLIHATQNSNMEMFCCSDKLCCIFLSTINQKLC